MTCHVDSIRSVMRGARPLRCLAACHKVALASAVLLIGACGDDDTSGPTTGASSGSGAVSTTSLSGGRSGIPGNAGGGRTGASAASASGRGAALAGRTGGAPAAGRASAAGSPAASSGNTPQGVPSESTASVLERNNHASRDGHFVQPQLTKANAMKMAPDADFKATFTGNMFASPLYLENGPGGKGAFYAVTTGNDVLALDESTGATVWKHNIGSSPTQSGAGCGNISPVGIVSTPVMDAAARTIYVAGAIGTNRIDRHEVHALAVDDGMPREGWPVDVGKISAAGYQFEATPQNQRSALSLVGGVVYVAYGGHIGDCGPYHGWVIGIDTNAPSSVGGWATLGQGEGIWATGGMASDGNGVFAITGNSTVGASSRMNSDSEQVVRVTGLGVLDRNAKNFFYPQSWSEMDRVDADFGASNPLYVSIPGATPSHYVVAISKDGHFYLLDAANLGGMGKPVVDYSVSTGSMSLSSVPTAYTTSAGVHVAFSIGSGATKCPQGGPSGKVIMSVKLTAGSPPTPSVAWCATLGGSATGPITTTTDGTSESIVWFMDSNKLIGVDGETGAVVFDGGSGTCAGVRKWASPIAVKGRIVVGADGKLCSWSPH
jgi:hypothetical protein